jgi:hypothetical protein
MGLVGFIALIFLSQAFAYQSSMTSEQFPVRWNTTTIPLQVVNNSNSLPASATLIDQSISEWNAVSGVSIQKTSTSKNQIKFSYDFSIYGPSVIGVTEVSYNSSGTINTASILLNEQHFNFSSTPMVSDGFNVYLGDVVTHELGHFLGLSHTEVLDASMFYSTFPGQADLAPDDIAGVRSKYSTGFGTISGSVKGGAQIGILGAHVQAISRKTGHTVGTISDENGDFEIKGLDVNDTYYLYTSPLKKLDALPASYSNVQSEFCPGPYLGSFFTPCGQQNDGFPQGITLTSAAPSVNVGIISVSCSLRSQDDYTLEKLGPEPEQVEIYNYSVDQSPEKTFVGFFRKNELSLTTYTNPDKFRIDLSGVAIPGSKSVQFKLISQPLGNMVEYHLKITQNSVILVDTYKTPNALGIFELDLGTETSLSSIAANNIFEVEIRARKLSDSLAEDIIPDFQNFGIDDHLPYLFLTSLKQGTSLILDSGAKVSDNASCLDAPFTYAVEKASFDLGEKSTTAAAGASLASCGTIEPPSGSGGGQSLLLSAIGFLMVLALFHPRKRAKNFLS